MKTTELNEMTIDELKQKLNATHKSLFELRGKAVTGRLEKPSRIKEARRDIARINTIIREREINESKGKKED